MEVKIHLGMMWIEYRVGDTSIRPSYTLLQLGSVSNFVTTPIRLHSDAKLSTNKWVSDYNKNTTMRAEQQYCD